MQYQVTGLLHLASLAKNTVFVVRLHTLCNVAIYNIYYHFLSLLVQFQNKNCILSWEYRLASVEMGWRAGSWFQDGNWTKTQDSRLRLRQRPSKKWLRAGLAAISTLVSAHKQEDKLHLEQERWLSRQNGNKTLLSTSVGSDKGIICLDVPESQFSSMKTRLTDNNFFYFKI